MEFDLVRDSNEAPPKFERSRLFFFFGGLSPERLVTVA